MLHSTSVASQRPVFFVEDSDQRWTGVEAGWSLFCRHPAVARVLEALRLDFKRTLQLVPWDEWIALPPSRREEYWAKTRYLILDRQERLLYEHSHKSETVLDDGGSVACA
jgi:hypothetical protein